MDDISVFEANTSDVTMQMMSHESDAEEGEKSALLRRRYPEVPATLDDVTSDDDVSDCDINCLLIVEENETVWSGMFLNVNAIKNLQILWMNVFKCRLRLNLVVQYL